MAAVDSFSRFSEGLDSPYRHGAAVTPHDTTELDYVTRAVYVGGTGTVTYLSAEGETVALLGNIPVGTVLRVRAKRVNATGTSATNLVALW